MLVVELVDGGGESRARRRSRRRRGRRTSPPHRAGPRATRRVSVAGDTRQQALELAYEFAEAAERQRGGALRIAGREALVHRRGGSGQRVAQEQAIEAVLERVAVHGGRSSSPRWRAVDAPADARSADPRVDRLELGVGDAEAARDDRLLQQLEHGARLEARRRHREHGSSACAREFRALAGRPVIVVRNRARLRSVAEHRVDQRRRGLEVGRDDQDVGRARRMLAREEREQLVLQHLELAGHRVADVDLDAAVVGAQPDAAAREIDHREDRVLHLREQRVPLAGRELRVVDMRGALVLEQQVDVRLRLPAPRGQQPIADFVMVGAGTARRGSRDASRRRSRTSTRGRGSARTGEDRSTARGH